MASLPALMRMTREQAMSMAPHPVVESRREELAAAETLELVQRLVAHNRWDAAAAAVAKAERRFAANPWCMGILEAMQRMIARRDRFLAKEALYASTALRSRLRAANEGAFEAGAPDDIPAFLRRKTEQGKGRADAFSH